MDHTMTKNPDSIPYNIWPAEALRLAEREAADSLGLTLFELMQRAGEAAFQLASCAYPASAHWLILCGHGNNGGDGYVVARLAQAAALAGETFLLQSLQIHKNTSICMARPQSCPYLCIKKRG